MIVSDCGNAVAMASIPVALWAGHVVLAQLYAVALVAGTCTVFFTLAQTAALPSVVGKEQLPAVMARNQSSYYGTTLAGPPLAGALFQVARAVPFLLDAVSYAVSVVSLCFIRTRFQGTRQETQTRIWTQIGEGWLWLWRHPLLRAMTLLITGTNFRDGHRRCRLRRHGDPRRLRLAQPADSHRAAAGRGQSCLETV